MGNQAARFDRLSPRMRECLRLVYDRKSSKEIAALLSADASGLAEATVAKYIADAVRLLGARNRKDAAEQLYAHENPVPYKPIVRSLGVDSGDLVMPTQPRKVPPWWRIPPPFRLSGDIGNDLTVAQRLFWILAVPILFSIAFGMLTLGLHTISDIVKGL